VKFLLLIPESRKKPFTESLLYKQIIRFLEEEKITEKFNIAFISINEGVVPAQKNLSRGETLGFKERSGEKPSVEERHPIPKTFPSGRSWISKAQIVHMADSIVEYLKSYILNHKSEINVIAYVRGSYLEAVRMANTRILTQINDADPRADQRSGSTIQEIFTDDELAQLKKKGIRWMKIGLRMPTAFIVFKMKIKYLLVDQSAKKSPEQLTLFEC
jgi:hypothetical protein